VKKIALWSFGLAVLIAAVLIALVMGRGSLTSLQSVSVTQPLSQASTSAAGSSVTALPAQSSVPDASLAATASTSVTPSPALAVAPPSTDAPATVAVAERNLAGTLSVVDGSASIVAPDQSTRMPKVGDKLYEGDSIITADGGEIHLDMADGGYVAVRPNTSMKVTKYQANGDKSDTSTISLIKGSLRSITGWIGRDTPQNYAITTPTATIGVRGTDHEPAYVPEGTPGQDPGTYDNVHEGGTTISNSAGRVDVTPNHAGFVDFHGSSKPRLLEHVPAFFQAPHRHDDLFVGKNAKVMASVEQRRSERVEQVRQQLRAQPAARAGERPSAVAGEHQIGRPAGLGPEHSGPHPGPALVERAGPRPAPALQQRAGEHAPGALGERTGARPEAGLAERPGMRPGTLPQRPTLPGQALPNQAAPGARLDFVQRMQAIRDNAQRAQAAGASQPGFGNRAAPGAVPGAPQPGFGNRATPGAAPGAMPGAMQGQHPQAPAQLPQRVQKPAPPVDPKKRPNQQ
jgi:hypothetical protein